MSHLRWTKAGPVNAPRYELRMPALKVESAVERHYNGRWFWVAYVGTVPGKSKRSSASAKAARASAGRWVQAELGRFEAEVKYARELAQLALRADDLERAAVLEGDEIGKVRSVMLKMPMVTDRALECLSREARAGIAAAREPLEREIAEASA